MVTSNGVKTTATLLSELWALTDYVKVTDTSYIKFNRTDDKLIFEIGYIGSVAARYGHFTNNQLESLNLGSTNTYIRIDIDSTGVATYHDKSQEVLTTGQTFKLYY